MSVKFSSQVVFDEMTSGSTLTVGVLPPQNEPLSVEDDVKSHQKILCKGYIHEAHVRFFVKHKLSSTGTKSSTAAGNFLVVYVKAYAGVY